MVQGKGQPGGFRNPYETIDLGWSRKDSGVPLMGHGYLLAQGVGASLRSFATPQIGLQKAA
jgi:hypothetical protein